MGCFFRLGISSRLQCKHTDQRPAGNPATEEEEGDRDLITNFPAWELCLGPVLSRFCSLGFEYSQVRLYTEPVGSAAETIVMLSCGALDTRPPQEESAKFKAFLVCWQKHGRGRYD